MCRWTVRAIDGSFGNYLGSTFPLEYFPNLLRPARCSRCSVPAFGDWIKSESFGLGSPAFHDELVRCETAQGLEAAAEVVSVDEVGEVAAKLAMIVIVEAFDGRILDGAVHPPGLAAIRESDPPDRFLILTAPGMPDLGQPMFDSVFFAAHVEHMRDPSCGRPVGVTGREGELDAACHCPWTNGGHGALGEDRVDLVRNGLDQGHEES